MSDFEPEGPVVSSVPAAPPDLKLGDRISTKLRNHASSIYLTPLLIEQTADLYAHLGGRENAHLYKYLPSGPYEDIESFTAMIKLLTESPLFSPFSVVTQDCGYSSNPNGTSKYLLGTALGMISLLNINPPHRSIEIGYVVFGPSLQRTTAATEAFYLLMKYCFEDLHYLRVEWKANDRNGPSKRAAQRLGFVFEGVFRKHMVVKGRSRDSAWFSVTDEEWFGQEDGGGNGQRSMGVKAGLEAWLDKDNFDDEGKQRRKLEELREDKGM